MGADITYNSQKITRHTFYISVSTQKKNIGFEHTTKTEGTNLKTLKYNP